MLTRFFKFWDGDLPKSIEGGNPKGENSKKGRCSERGFIAPFCPNLPKFPLRL